MPPYTQIMVPPGISERDWALWRAVGLMGRRLSAALEQSLQASAGISTAEFEVLLALRGAQGGNVRARDLADMLAWEKSRVSHLVTRMVARSFVERVQCDTDLRGTMIGLAPAGEAALESALPGYVATVRDEFASRLDGSDAETVTRVALDVARGLGVGSCEGALHEIEATVGASVQPA